ncbi:phage protein [Salibacterium sp. K-3]
MNSFNRKGDIILGRASLSSDDFDYEFDAELTDEPKKNHLEVTLYNLSHDRINRIATGDPCIVNGGYEGDTGSVFVGVVYESSTEKNGVDRETTVKAVDGTDQRDDLKVNKTYKEGTRASQIITDLCSIVGLSIGALNLPEDKQYRQGKHEAGTILYRLRLLAEDCGAKFHIKKGMAYIRPPDEGDNVRFVFSPVRGLIGSPEPFVEEDDDGNEVKGYNVKALLNHRVQADALITIKSKNVNGQYRVRKVTHTWSSDEAISEMEVVE